MPAVTILRRQKAVRFPQPQQLEEVAAVTYSTPAVPPRDVHLPLEGYRVPTAEELAQNPRYELVPTGPEAEQRERKAIEQDIHLVARTPPPTFEL